VRPLNGHTRQEEVARMLSGARVTDEARAAAGRLLSEVS
jgi:DNA repair protein RecN (Recombination protein N)